MATTPGFMYIFSYACYNKKSKAAYRNTALIGAFVTLHKRQLTIEGVISQKFKT